MPGFLNYTAVNDFLRLSLSFLLLAVISNLESKAENWPAWRGPLGTGVCTEKKIPTQWSTNKNVKWVVPLPERGNSTPVIWGEGIFVTQAVERENKRALFCFNRKNGKLLWQKSVPWPAKELTHETNPFCSASPVTDGERVVVWHGSAGVYCYDFSGTELWKKDLGEQRHIWGYGSSPVLEGDLCFINFGPGERSFLIALDKKTGETVWKINGSGGDSGETKGEIKPQWIGSWSTPVVMIGREGAALIHLLPGRVCALNPLNGKEIWTCSGLNPLVYTSPLYDDGVVVAMGGFNGTSIAVKSGGKGDVTATHRLWQTPKTAQRIGSGVIHQGHIYILNDPGVAECIELQTGKTIWKERLKGPGPKIDSWGSMVLVDGKILITNQGGDTFILQASPTFKLLETNSLFEPTLASVAISDGELFIRTHKNLWCLGERSR